MTRQDLFAFKTAHSGNCHEMLLTIEGSYLMEINDLLGTDFNVRDIRLVKSLRHTHVRLPKVLVPEHFYNTILEQNGKKGYHYDIEFSQRNIDFICVKLHNKPFIPDGIGPLFFFFKELLQYFQRSKLALLAAKRKNTRPPISEVKLSK